MDPSLKKRLKRKSADDPSGQEPQSVILPDRRVMPEDRPDTEETETIEAREPSGRMVLCQVGSGPGAQFGHRGTGVKMITPGLGESVSHGKAFPAAHPCALACSPRSPHLMVSSVQGLVLY